MAHADRAQEEFGAYGRMDFETVYNTYHEELKRFIYTIARCDREMTEDISQNVWQNVFQYLSGLKNPEAVRGWLYTIARNEAKRYFTKRDVRLFTDVSELGADPGLEPADEGESHFPDALANTDLLIKLLNRLSKSEQQLVLLYYYYDVGLTEIADMNGANYNTVKSTFRRTMAKLKKAAEEMTGDEPLRN